MHSSWPTSASNVTSLTLSLFKRGVPRGASFACGGVLDAAGCGTPAAYRDAGRLRGSGDTACRRDTTGLRDAAGVQGCWRRAANGISAAQKPPRIQNPAIPHAERPLGIENPIVPHDSHAPRIQNPVIPHDGQVPRTQNPVVPHEPVGEGRNYDPAGSQMLPRRIETPTVPRKCVLARGGRWGFRSRHQAQRPKHPPRPRNSRLNRGRGGRFDPAVVLEDQEPRLIHQNRLPTADKAHIPIPLLNSRIQNPALSPVYAGIPWTRRRCWSSAS